MLAAGTCVTEPCGASVDHGTGTGPDRGPTVTLTLSMADFLRLATGAVGMARLVTARRLKLRGDLRFALRLAGLFDIPKAHRHG